MDKSSDQSIASANNLNSTSQSSNNSTSVNTSSTGRRNFNRGRWLKEEDDKLRNLVNLYGDSTWNEIAKFFQDRSDVQCQQRWDKVVNPELVKGPWTKEVRDTLMCLCFKF